MTPQDPLDARIADRLRSAAPSEAPVRILEATLAAVSGTPQGGGRRWFASRPARLLAAAVVAGIAVLVGAQLGGLIGRPIGNEPSPSSSAAPSTTPSPSASADASATPSPSATSQPSPTPAIGADEALLSFTPLCDVIPPIISPTVTIMGDGRVVWAPSGPGEPPSLNIRELNSAGMDRVRAAVAETGVFDADGEFSLVLRPGAEPPGHGLCRWTFRWAGGPDPVVVRSDMWLGEEEESAYYEPAPERRAIHDLAMLVQAPESWIESDGWADADARPYEPDGYVVIATRFFPEAATEGAPDVDAVPWPFAEGPDTFGEPTPGGNGRCAVGDAAAVEELTAALAAAGLEQFESVIGWANATLPWSSQGASLDVLIHPQHPDGEPPCGGSSYIEF